MELHWVLQTQFNDDGYELTYHLHQAYPVLLSTALREKDDGGQKQFVHVYIIEKQWNYPRYYSTMNFSWMYYVWRIEIFHKTTLSLTFLDVCIFLGEMIFS